MFTVADDEALNQCTTYRVAAYAGICRGSVGSARSGG